MPVEITRRCGTHLPEVVVRCQLKNSAETSTLTLFVIGLWHRLAARARSNPSLCCMSTSKLSPSSVEVDLIHSPLPLYLSAEYILTLFGRRTVTVLNVDQPHRRLHRLFCPSSCSWSTRPSDSPWSSDLYPRRVCPHGRRNPRLHVS